MNKIIFSEKHRENLKKAWTKRKLIPVSDITRKKLSDVMKKRRRENPLLGVNMGMKNGMYKSARFGEKNPMWGKKHTDKAKITMSQKATGRQISEETRAKLSGRIPWNKGKLFLSKEKNPNWNGGTSRLPYPFDFDEKLKDLIRERDNHTCRYCMKKWELGINKFPVHHIFYDKDDFAPNHLATLCVKCHNKSSVKKNRELFIKWFNSTRQKKLSNKII